MTHDEPATAGQTQTTAEGPDLENRHPSHFALFEGGAGVLRRRTSGQHFRLAPLPSWSSVALEDVVPADESIPCPATASPGGSDRGPWTARACRLQNAHGGEEEASVRAVVGDRLVVLSPVIKECPGGSQRLQVQDAAGQGVARQVGRRQPTRA